MKGKQHLTIVIKLGTSSIVDEKTHEPLLSILTSIVETAVQLHRNGHRVVIVSSGAVGVGLLRMDMKKRPKHLPQVQALAAVGQCRLMSLWDSLFGHLRQPVAQILLTRGDIADRTQYLNAQNTFSELINMGVIPIVNENDTLAVSEIKFGDNDTLSAITAAMVHADYLFLMTDVDCLYTANPRTNPDAKPIEVVSDISTLAADVSSAGSSLGTGGMSTKIVAARLATSAGVTTIITRSSKPKNLVQIVDYIQSIRERSSETDSSSSSPSSSQILEPTSALNLVSTAVSNAATANGSSEPETSPPPPPLHTRFLPSPSPIRSRSFWLLHGLHPHGTIYIDQGAYNAVLSKAGLLPVGVVHVDGHFGQQECVRVVVVQKPSHATKSLALNGDYPTAGTTTTNPYPSFIPASTTPSTPVDSTSSTAAANGIVHEPREVGRALVNYSSVEISRIMGLRSSQIDSILGYADSEYIALRENISFFPGFDGSSTGLGSGMHSRSQTPAPGLGTPGIE